ncbi:alpha/beta fold hydrolase [Janthinobacterium fluminis]|uniref:Alpha/beta fold hydrolase n=1 Tax=Janthinobacterium fluminis TaxID=2987524 RepID=A0ABT5JYT8_9BURK|nr:alpha/beta fold hydrolase [Janthinobacterium fluminis]MDC8757318.1 alpha/beta fold hydrolase [Janthinobacterium fluminis]
MNTQATPPDARPAVVLLHSSMSSRAQWSELVAQLAASFRCIAVDLLGYGASPFPADSGAAAFTLAHEVDAVNAAIAARLAPGQPFHLVGHSYGGATALRMARQMRGRVLSLAVFEPVAFHLLAPDDAARLDIEGVVAAIDAAATPRDAARIFIDYWNRPGVFDALGGAQQERFTAQIAKVRLDFQALLGEAATLDDMARLDLPALVMSGQNSPASTRRLAERLAAALPNAAAVQTKGGHMAPISHSQAVNPLIAAFLAGAAVVNA